MDSRILDYAKSLLGENFVQETSQKLGENSESVSKAVSTIVPTIFSAMSNKTAQDPSFLTTIISEAKNIFTNHSLEGLSSFIGGDAKNAEGTQTGSFLFDLFGGGLHGIIEKIASFANIKTSSTRQLFETSGLASLGSIGKNLLEDGGSIESIGQFFSSNKASLLSAIPASLGIGSLLSHAHVPTAQNSHGAHDAGHTHAQDTAKAGAAGANKFLVPVILTVIGLALLFWLFKSCHGNEAQHDGLIADTAAAVSQPEPVASAESGRLDSVTGNYIYNTGNTISIKLPNGTTIDSVGEFSTESKLFNFLNDKSIAVDTLDKTKGWISFDRLYFQTASSNLTEESKNQLVNISKILAAFPDAAIKLGGYTDSTGDAKANLTLSGQRANAAMAQIVKDGLAADRVKAEGYGKEHPIASNETAEGRAQNRRIDVRVTKK